jgi:hypothetical protein
MILEEATFEAFGYYPIHLSGKSHMPILASCEFCGKFGITTKGDYRTFCRSCMLFLTNINITPRELTLLDVYSKCLLVHWSHNPRLLYPLCFV